MREVTREQVNRMPHLYEVRRQPNLSWAVRQNTNPVQGATDGKLIEEI
jgi:hypothetical protein